MPSFNSLEGKSVLDLGCGRGGGLAYLASKHGVKEAIGIDTCQYFVNYAREEHKSATCADKLQFVAGDVENLDSISELSGNCVDNAHANKSTR